MFVVTTGCKPVLRMSLPSLFFLSSFTTFTFSLCLLLQPFFISCALRPLLRRLNHALFVADAPFKRLFLCWVRNREGTVCFYNECIISKLMIDALKSCCSKTVEKYAKATLSTLVCSQKNRLTLKKLTGPRRIVTPASLKPLSYSVWVFAQGLPVSWCPLVFWRFQ